MTHTQAVFRNSFSITVASYAGRPITGTGEKKIYLIENGWCSKLLANFLHHFAALSRFPKCPSCKSLLWERNAYSQKKKKKKNPDLDKDLRVLLAPRQSVLTHWTLQDCLKLASLSLTMLSSVHDSALSGNVFCQVRQAKVITANDFVSKNLPCLVFAYE